jgi:hypothetical protein
LAVSTVTHYWVLSKLMNPARTFAPSIFNINFIINLSSMTISKS